MSIRNALCPCRTKRRKASLRLAGYLDTDGNYQDGTNPDPTYGGTIPAPDQIAPGTYAPQAGYDAIGRLLPTPGTPINWTWITGAALAAFVVAEIFAEGKHEAGRWSRR